MKYYAVTDDPRELYHYGVKGMKWGQHLFGDDLRPKSPGYKRAASKLRATLRKAHETHQKNAEMRSANRYNKQVRAAMQRSQLSQQKYGWDQVSSDMRANDKAFKMAQKAVRAEQKRDKKIAAANNRQYIANTKYEARVAGINAANAARSAKAEKRFDKYMQEAREGRIRMANLSDEQIARIQNRLNTENAARRLGGTEKPRFRARLKEATREGILQGTTKGIAAGIEEIARAKIQNRLANKMVLDQKNRNEAKRQKEATRIKNKKTHREMVEDLKQESYKAQLEAGVGLLDRSTVNASVAASRLSKAKATIAERDRQQKFLANQNDKRDEAWNSYLTEKGLSENQALKNITGKGDYGVKHLSEADKNRLISKHLALQDYNKKKDEEAKDKAAYDEINKHEKAMEKYNEEMRQYKRNIDTYTKEVQDYKKNLKDYNDRVANADIERQNRLDKALESHAEKVKAFEAEKKRIEALEQKRADQIRRGEVPTVKSTDLILTVKDPGRPPTINDIPRPSVGSAPIEPKKPRMPKTPAALSFETRRRTPGGGGGGKNPKNK